MSLFGWIFGDSDYDDTNTDTEAAYHKARQAEVERQYDELVALEEANRKARQQPLLNFLNTCIDTDDIVMQWKAKGFDIKNRPITFEHFVNHARGFNHAFEFRYADDVNYHISDEILHEVATHVLHNVIKFSAYGEDFSYEKIASIEARKKSKAKAAAFLKVLSAFDYPEDANA